MRRMHRRALMLAISFGLLSLGGLPHEGAAAPRFLPEEPPPAIGDPDIPNGYGPMNIRGWTVMFDVTQPLFHFVVVPSSRPSVPLRSQQPIHLRNVSR